MRWRSATSPSLLRPKWKSWPTTTARAFRQPTRTSSTKASAGSAARSASKCTTRTMSTPAGFQERQLLVEVSQQQWGRPGAHHAGRVLVEGDDNRHCPDLGGGAPDPFDEPAVAEVHAVERPDRHHRALGRRRALARVVRDLHSPTIPALGGQRAERAAPVSSYLRSGHRATASQARSERRRTRADRWCLPLRVPCRITCRHCSTVGGVV